MFAKSSTNRIFDINDDSGMVVTVASSSGATATPVLKAKEQKPIRFTAKSKPKNDSIGETASGYAASNSSSGAGRPSNTSAEIQTFALKETVLEALGMDINQETTRSARKEINKFYRDMYYHDSICGTVASLLSVLPFSDFTIIADTSKQVEVYNEAVETLGLKTLPMTATTEYNVVGAFLASLDWDSSTKSFKGILPHSIDYAELIPPAYYGKDPIIDLEIPENIRNLFDTNKNKKNGKVVEQTDSRQTDVPDLFKDSLKDSSLVRLKEEDTIFIPRKGMLSDFGGVSYFRRALLPWLIEKAFIRGMLDQSYKRQRPISHITMGDGTEWAPSPEEMAAVVQLFIDADLDPVASYVVTRSGISLNEVRNGADYFKWSDVYDNLASIKLKALGVSDTFLSSEANYATMEQTLSVFMEQQRAHRYMLQKELFEDRVFIRIAAENRFIRKSKSKGETADIEYAIETAAVLSAKDKARLALPTVQWNKRLLPESDDAYLQQLSTLEEKGVPLPIRVWAAAGGFNIDTLLESQDNDLETRGKVAEWIKEKKKLMPAPDEGAEEASGLIKPIPFSKRTFEDDVAQQLRDVPNLDSNGRRRVTTAKGRKVLNEKKHKIVAEVASNLAKIENAKIRDSRPVNRGFFVMPGLLDEEDDED